MLRVISKPDGYDLNAARSEKSESARDWLPEDALYSAQEQMKDHPVHGALLVAWYTLSENGLPIVKWCLHNSDCRMGIALVNDVEFEMQMSARNT